MPRLLDLVEHAAVGEVGRLRLLPAAEHAVDRDEVELGKALEIFGSANSGWAGRK